MSLGRLTWDVHFGSWTYSERLHKLPAKRQKLCMKNKSYSIYIDKDGRPRTRAIIVRFRSERVCDEVFRARTKLKSHNAERRTDKIFINDDLTARRAKLSFDARASKRANKIADCWTAYGRVMIKDLAGKVLQLNSASDLPR